VSDDLQREAEAEADRNLRGDLMKQLAARVTVDVPESLVDRELVTDATRDAFRDAVTSPAFLSLLPEWIKELRNAASSHPETGACTVATSLQLWTWTMNHLRENAAAADELAEIVCPLLAARCLALDVANDASPQLRRDLSLAFAARAAARAGAVRRAGVGHRRHLVDAEGCATCYGVEEPTVSRR
jgi:hypothetical protein